MSKYIDQLGQKENYEISCFEGRSFSFNHFYFSTVARPQKFFTLYLPDSPRHYWLGIFLKFSAIEGKKLYSTYINCPQKLRDDFYQSAKHCHQAFDLLSSNNTIKQNDYRLFIKSIRALGKIASMNLEGAEQYLEKKVIKLIDDQKLREALTFPAYTSYIQKENEAILNIINNLKGYDLALLKKGEGRLNSYHDLPEILSRHRQIWGWAFTNYGSERLPSPLEILRRMKQIVNNLDKEQLSIELNNKKRKKKIKLLSSLQPEVRKVIDLLDAITELRDQRKSLWLKISLDFKIWLKKVSRLHFNDLDLMWLTREEQCFLNRSNLKIYTKIIEQRKKGCAALYGYSGEASQVLVGKEFEIIKNKFLYREKQEAFFGVSASGGKIVGKVRNVRSGNDFNKFKKGEILIASHTTPDYLTIMKKAGAILTERGGITSHAAIISRELKKPCIVGIQGIFNNFIDGQKVEVDADKGLVSKA
jgi:phosphohistidine swiveling domain-containing protein